MIYHVCQFVEAMATLIQPFKYHSANMVVVLSVLELKYVLEKHLPPSRQSDSCQRKLLGHSIVLFQSPVRKRKSICVKYTQVSQSAISLRYSEEGQLLVLAVQSSLNAQFVSETIELPINKAKNDHCCCTFAIEAVNTIKKEIFSSMLK